MQKIRPSMSRPKPAEPDPTYEQAVERFALGADLVPAVTPVKGKTGRPPKADHGAQLVVRVPTPLLEAVDKVIAGRLDSPNRSVVVREALVLWLERKR